MSAHKDVLPCDLCGIQHRRHRRGGDSCQVRQTRHFREEFDLASVGRNRKLLNACGVYTVELPDALGPNGIVRCYFAPAWIVDVAECVRANVHPKQRALRYDLIESAWSQRRTMAEEVATLAFLDRSEDALWSYIRGRCRGA